MTPDSQNEKDDGQVDPVIRLSEFRVPTYAVSKTARLAVVEVFGRVGRLLRQGTRLATGSGSADKPIVSDLFEPRPCGGLHVEFLRDSLAQWTNSESGEPASGQVHVIVGAPFSGVLDAVDTVAGGLGLAPVIPPAPRDLLRDDIQVVLPDGVRIVISRLERFFVRHQDGLVILRKLVRDAGNRDAPVLITCGSWAWEYLQLVLPCVRVLPEPHTMMPLDGPALREWLLSPLGDAPFETAPAVPDSTRGGRRSRASASENGEGAVDDFFARLAARSRGNPGVARSIWRGSLSDVGVANAAFVLTRDGEPVAAVKPPAGVVQPAEISSRGFWVLHELLLSGRGDIESLALALPLGEPDIDSTLDSLRAAGAVDHVAGNWEVRPEAYPAVRQALQSAAFTVDSL